MSQLRKINSDNRIIAETLVLAKAKGMSKEDAVALTGLSQVEIQAMLSDPSFKQDLERATAQLKRDGKDTEIEIELQVKRVIKQIGRRVDDVDASTSDIVRMGDLLVKMLALVDRRTEVAARRDSERQTGRPMPTINIYLGDDNTPTHSMKTIDSRTLEIVEDTNERD